jgi:choline dehydrogenase
MKSTSRGNVTINSTDTTDNPVVSVNWLQTSTDQQLAIQGFHRARDLSASFGVVTAEVAPGPTVQTDAEILEFIKETVGPSHHAVASCEFSSSKSLSYTYCFLLDFTG